MGRIYSEIQANGRRLWTLFDTGAKSSYVKRSAASGFVSVKLPAPYRVGLGGQHRTLDEVCHIVGEIEGKLIDFEAYITEEIGTDEWGRPIDVLFGALAMQKFHIHIQPDEKRLDMTNYPDEFIEY